MKIVTAEQMQRIDRRCAEIGLPTVTLMENAGRAVAEAVTQIMGGLLHQQSILVLAGPGNNGGDGLVAARYLHDRGAGTNVYLCGQRPSNDRNLRLVKERSITCIDAAGDEKRQGLIELLSSATVVVDALFGTGTSRPLGGIFSQTLQKVREAKRNNPALRIIALDLPSGLNADTGETDPACLSSDNTVTLGFPKVGLFTSPGAGKTGKLTIVDIGIPPYLAKKITTELITRERVRPILPERPVDANKGTFGHVLVIAGSNTYIGAAFLACSGAMRVGAGLVTLAIPASLQPVLASKLTETTYLLLPEDKPGVLSSEAVDLMQERLPEYDVLLMGCGIGQGEEIAQLVSELLFKTKYQLPLLVLDADALNILAKIPEWWRKLSNNAILTPHPGEMARLTGLPVGKIQSDRLGVAKRMARQWGKTVLLKGAHSVIATPNGRAFVSPFANPGLASAGTGDVLSGAIAGLLAQGSTLPDAAVAAVYLHGEAGELVRVKLGDAGMIASDLLPVLPVVIKQTKGS